MRITLTTDFGLQDYYVGALKGALIRRCPAIELIDISHQIQPFDIIQAALVVSQVWQEFPESTIHILAVNCVYAPNGQFVVLRKDGHYFLAPDNGLLTLLFQDINPEDLRIIGSGEMANTPHFAVKDIFSEAAAHLAAGQSFETLGTAASEPLLRRIGLQPVITPARIRGTVIHIDNFDNVIVNIQREVFQKACNDRSFALYFKRNDPITMLHHNYCDVPVGEPLCLFNSAGYLEIAINFGRAATLLSLKTEDVVEVVFE